MTWLLDSIKWLMALAKPENLQAIANLGGPWWVSYVILTAIIFSETGLLVGFFLPGDSLLFTAGFLASKEVFNLGGLMLLLCIAAIVGDAFNYYLGRQFGEHVFERGRLRFVKHSHLMAAKAFYDKHGGKAIVLARFAPLVRTFTPFVAGVAKMSYRQFVFYNVIGGIAWVCSMLLAGFWLGKIDWVQKNFEKVVVGIVVLSIMPIVIEAFKAWLANRRSQSVLEEPPVADSVK